MKKWTFLLAAGLLAGATPVFTGCIDNDEPEGITILRGAKAELLKAKAAVEAAKVAEVEANAALIKAQAELVAAQARTEEAKAKQEEAKARQEELEAELKEIENEEARADLEEKIKEYERAQKKWEAEQAQAAIDAQNAQKEWELKQAMLEAQYQQVLVQLAQAKVGLAQAQQQYLAKYETAVTNALKEYRTKSQAVTEAMRDLADAEADVDKDPEYIKRSLEWALKEAQASQTGAQEALDKAKAELEEAKSLESHDYAVKYNELNKELKDIEDNYYKLVVEAAEAVRTLWETEVVPYNALIEAYDEFLEEEKKTEAFEFTVSEHFPYHAIGNTYRIPEFVYTNLDILEETNEFALAKFAYEECLRKLKTWERDANDDLWTNETISQLKAEKAEAAKELEQLKKSWKEAVDAFKAGSFPEYDATKITGYADVKTTVEALNAQIKAYNDAAAAIKASNKAKEAAEKAKLDAEKQADTDKTAAYTAAEKTYADAVKALPSLKKIEEDKLLSLKKTLDEAEAALAKAPDNAILKQEYETAKKNYDKQIKLVANFESTKMKEYEDARSLAKTNADVAWNKAYETAKTTRDNAVKAENAKITANEAAQTKAETEGQKAVNAAVKAFEVFEQNLTESVDGYWADAAVFDSGDFQTALDNKKELKLSAVTQLNRDALKALIEFRSNVLYGTTIWTSNIYGDADARLTEISVKDIQALIDKEAAADEDNPIYGDDYLDLYHQYGAVGYNMFIDKQIEIATSWLTNGEELQAMIKPVQDALDALEAEQKAVVEAEEAKYEELNNKYDAIMDKLDEIYAPVDQALAGIEPIQEVLEYVTEALGHLVSNASDGEYSTEDVQFYIEVCEGVVSKAEKTLYDAETAVMKAEDNLTNWNSGALDLVQQRKEALNDARTALKDAEDDLAAAREALTQAIEKLAIE